MNIEKIIKFYFLSVMIVCSTVAVGADRNMQTFMANVLGFNSVQNAVVEVDDRKIDFDVSRNKDVLSIVPGSKNVNMMKISFKTYDDAMTLNGLNFKVSGVDSDNIDGAVLKNGEEILSEGNIANGFISFGNIGYKTEKNSEGAVSIFIDAGKNLRAGERITLNIVDKKDIYMLVGGESFDLKTSFPVKGKPLSVVLMRGWEPGYTVPKNAVSVKK